MKKIIKLLCTLLALLLPATAVFAGHRLLALNFKSLQVVLNDDWRALPVMKLGSDDVLHIGFDELSHNVHRLVYHLEPCNPDWTPCEGLFESDWLEGFNDRPIEDYEKSLNTTVLYTHYSMQLPNDDTRLRMSGNYRLHIIDEDDDDRTVAIIELRVVEPVADMSIGVTTNTDVDLNVSHQQLSMNLRYGPLRVVNAAEQIQTIVMQNGREDNMKVNVRPNYVTTQGMQWEHNRQLIFDAGNEYRKFEVLDPSHPTFGLAHMTWDESTRTFHAVPFVAEPRRSYIYDEDADGAFVLRNEDRDDEAPFISDYVYVHYKARPVRHYADARIVVDGRWAVEPMENYVMTYDETDQSYNVVVMQKLGYYNYQLLMVDLDGNTHTLPEEGSFFQTENRYQAFVYYREVGGRSWRLVAFCEGIKR
ncbi:MAG: DUF5103 domain-containing protein [Prevotella sp.]|nr:DUF5103 domain-containing protein [Prevotella sp.]